MREAHGAILCAVAVLAACSPPADEDASSSDTRTAIPAAREPAVVQPDATEAKAGTTLPPPDAEYRYIGRWAETAAQCRGEAWTLTRDRLTAPDDIACAFGTVEQSPGGYTIDATCAIGGEEEDNTITLRFAESAKAMLVEGATSLPERGLVYCGDAP